MIRSEFRRAVTDTSFATLLVVLIALNAMAVYGNAAQLNGGPSTTDEDPAALTTRLVGLGFGGYLCSMIYGAVVGARDFSNKSIIRRCVLARGPERLLAAKSAAMVVPATIFAIASAGSAVLTTVVMLRLGGRLPEWSTESTVVVLGVLAAVFAMTYLGFAVGWCIRSPIVSALSLLAYTIGVETALFGIAPRFARFLPGGAEQAITLDKSSTDLIFPVWGGYALLVGWVVALFVVAVARTWKRDLA